MIHELTHMPPFQGSLNQNVPYRFQNESGMGTIGLRRCPIPNKDLLLNLVDEYRRIGFTGLGGRVQLRTPHEQELFAEKAIQAGLRVVPPIHHEDASKVFFLYMEGLETLDKHLRGSQPRDIKERTIIDIFDDLHHAHKAGAIYGDRWAGNMMVHPKYGLIHLDWDIAIEGKYARELDVAQVVYHTLWAAKMSENPVENIAMPIILNILNTVGRQWIDIKVFLKFVTGLEAFLRNTPVGKMEETILCFAEVVKKSHTI